MCIPAILGPLAAAGGAAGATAAGATAAAGMSLGGILQTVGLVASVAAPLMQGAAEVDVARAEAAAITERMATEARLTATEDLRTRMQMRSAMRRQSAELVARGISLDSPTAVLLGQTAARELSFASQEVRSRGAATQTELRSTEKIARARAATASLKGTFDAAGAFLTGAPDVWPELLK